MTLAETIERLNNIMKIPGVKPEFEVVVEIHGGLANETAQIKSINKGSDWTARKIVISTDPELKRMSYE